jgi:hypothetical protein
MADVRRIAVIFGLGAFVAVAARAQSYGPGDQTLTLGAPSFTGQDDQGALHPDGYLYASGAFSYSAPVSLPDGAEITQICLYAANSKPGAFLVLSFEAIKLAPGGQSPGVVPVPGGLVVATFTSGYDSVCTDPFAYTFHQAADVDGDGQTELIAHRLTGTFSDVNDGSLALGGARIFWHRQVSPPPATPTFTDVPATDIFFPYVEALAASGITGGCSAAPPQYCPSSPLTRGQMAVFLAKSLGLQWPF